MRFLPLTNSEGGVDISIHGLGIRGCPYNEQKKQAIRFHLDALAPARLPARLSPGTPEGKLWPSREED